MKGTALQGGARRRTALGLVLVAPMLAHAQAVDTSGWKCDFCPFEDGQVESEVEAGSLYADGVTAKFGEFDGIDEDGGYLDVDGFTGERRENGSFWNVTAQDLGLDNGSLVAAAGREGLWRADVGYVAAPHNVYDTTVTPFVAGSASPQSLPAGWVRAGNTQLMTALDDSLRTYDLETTRERFLFGGELGGSNGWRTELRYVHETRDGRRLIGSSFITTASQLAGPVDYVTDQVDWSARYQTARGAVGVSYLGSFFSNRQVDLAWENPFSAIAPGADLGRTALAPDNHFNQLALNLAYELGPAWRLGLNAALGRGKQDDSFLPYTTNPLIATGPLPRTSLGGDVDVRHADLQLSADFGRQVDWLKGLRARLNYRYYERDNVTPQANYEYVESDSFPAGAATSLPYGYRRQKLSLSGDYDLARLLWAEAGPAMQLSGGWDRDDWDRDFQEAENSIEDQGWVRLRVSPLAWLSFDARYGAANRDTDPYVTLPSVDAPQNPLLRKYNLADRERDFWDFELDLSLPGSIALSLGGFERQDEYVNSVLGLQSSRDRGATADLSWTINEKASVYAFYGWQEIDSLQSGSQSFGMPDWQAESVDEFDTVSVGLRLNELAEKWSVSFDYFLVDGQGDIEMRSGTAAAFPPLTTRSHGPSLEVEYRATPALEIIGMLRYEHFDSHDWALEGVDPDTVPAVLASGADPYDYDANLVGISFRYRFGGDAGTAAEPEPGPEP
jgi:MtrB/PioB family decaheme-associated outer membrane protein